MRVQCQSKQGRHFKLTTWKESLHEISIDNGVTVAKFARPKNFTIKSTMFPHNSIYKYTWMSPHEKPHNQSDHILIER
jgi:hypothetical protein